MKNFGKFYDALLEYKSKNGNLRVPHAFCCNDGYKLGLKVCYVRIYRDKLTDEEFNKLEKIGFIWRCKNKRQSFQEVYEMILKYIEEYGNSNIPVGYVTENGIRLGLIIYSFKNRSRKLSEEEAKKLKEIGIDFIRQKKNYNKFDKIYEELKTYVKQHGNCDVPRDYISDDGTELGASVVSIKGRKNRMSEKKIAKLDELGFKWGIHNRRLSFDEIYELIKEYKAEHGNCLIPFKYVAKSGARLGHSVYNIQHGFRKITEEQKKKLLEIGFYLRKN